MATIFDVRDALTAIDGVNVYHFNAPEQRSNKYIIWGEKSINSDLYANNKCRRQRVRGEIWYYTNEEYDPILDKISTTLNEKEIEFNMTDIGYDNTLRQIVYVISWEADCGIGKVYR